MDFSGWIVLATNAHHRHNKPPTQGQRTISEFGVIEVPSSGPTRPRKQRSEPSLLQLQEAKATAYCFVNLTEVRSGVLVTLQRGHVLLLPACNACPPIIHCLRATPTHLLFLSSYSIYMRVSHSISLSYLTMVPNSSLNE